MQKFSTWDSSVGKGNSIFGGTKLLPEDRRGGSTEGTDRINPRLGQTDLLIAGVMGVGCEVGTRAFELVDIDNEFLRCLKLELRVSEAPPFLQQHSMSSGGF